MPSVNLRLTDEQHFDLRERAAANKRSLQHEIVNRCFAQTMPMVVQAMTSEGIRIGPADEEDHFKPDPKSSTRR